MFFQPFFKTLPVVIPLQQISWCRAASATLVNAALMPNVQSRMIDANVALMWRWLARGWLHGFDQNRGCPTMAGSMGVLDDDTGKTYFQTTPCYHCTSMTGTRWFSFLGFHLNVFRSTRHFGRSVPFGNFAQRNQNDQFAMGRMTQTYCHEMWRPARTRSVKIWQCVKTLIAGK